MTDPGATGSSAEQNALVERAADGESGPKFEKTLVFQGLVVPTVDCDGQAFVRFVIHRSNRWLLRAAGLDRKDIAKLSNDCVLTEIETEIQALRGPKQHTSRKVDKEGVAQVLRVEVMVRGIRSEYPHAKEDIQGPVKDAVLDAPMFLRPALGLTTRELSPHVRQHIANAWVEWLVGPTLHSA